MIRRTDPVIPILSTSTDAEELEPIIKKALNIE